VKIAMRTAVFCADLICFAGFAWAMLRHFQPAGKPRPGMILTGAIVPVFAALHLAALFTRPVPFPLTAIALYAASAALFWSAVAATRGRHLSACFQRQVPPALVRTGPYRRIRHPFYLAYTLTWIAGFVATGWWPLALTAIFMASLYLQAARQEERCFLESPLQAEYRRYMQGAGRFVPRVFGRT
jgi:protein-S-isoprenylcysteine O-methyltransferase Ste14